MNRHLVLLIYNILLPFALLASLPGYVLKMLRRGNYRRGFGERFGFYSASKRAAMRGLERPLWIHAVSVGEVNIAKKLIDALREIDPKLPILISTTTPTGFAIAEESKASLAVYNPVDFWPVSRKALRAINPRALILVEAEVWPNLVRGARQRGLEVSLVNARLSPRSERRFRRFRAFTAPVFGMLTRVCVQESQDVDRWRSLGVDAGRILHAGSIKFDRAGGVEPSLVPTCRELLSTHLGGRRARVLLAGSTHPGEEALLGEVYLRLRKQFDDLYFLVAPRHVERRDELLAEMRAAGLTPALRSEIGDATPEAGTDCLVIDTTGELAAWYYTAELVVIGKSFLAQGGQNPVEPLFAGKPVYFGPHMENFAALETMLREVGGACQVADADALESALVEALESPDQAAAMSQRALDALAVHKGAASRTAKVILACKTSEYS